MRHLLRVRGMAAVLLLFVFLGVWLVLYAFGPPLGRFSRGKFTAIGDWLARHFDQRRRGAAFRREGAWRSWVPAAVILLAGVIAAGTAATLFDEVAEHLDENTSVLQRLDGVVHEQQSYWSSRINDLFFLSVTRLGDPLWLGTLVAGVVILLLVRKHQGWAFYLAMTAITGGLLNTGLKRFFERARPEAGSSLYSASGYSFPSGHSMGSMIVYAALGWLSLRLIPTARKQPVIAAAFSTLILSIGVSRLYLGVHWFSDVVGGFAAGFAWVATATAAYEAWMRTGGRRTLSEPPRTIDRAGE